LTFPLFLSYLSFIFSASFYGKVAVNKMVAVGQPSQPYRVSTLI